MMELDTKVADVDGFETTGFDGTFWLIEVGFTIGVVETVFAGFVVFPNDKASLGAPVDPNIGGNGASLYKQSIT